MACNDKVGSTHWQAVGKAKTEFSPPILSTMLELLLLRRGDRDWRAQEKIRRNLPRREFLNGRGMASDSSHLEVGQRRLDNTFTGLNSNLADKTKTP